MKKLARPVKVWNVNELDNVGGSVIHEVEVNIYFKEYVERA